MKRFTYFAVASLAVSGMAWVGMPRAWAGDQGQGAARQAGQQMQGAVNSATTQPVPGQALTDRNMEETRDTIQTAVQAALTKGDLSNFVDRFAKADRDRLGKDVSSDHPDLDAIVGDIQSAWHAKYHEDFKMQKPEQVFASAQFLQGDVKDTARLAGEKQTPDDKKAVDKLAADQPDPNMATVVFQGTAQDQPRLFIRLVAEGTVANGWKIKIPDEMNYNQLHGNLVRELTAIRDSKDNWPNDVNEAYRAVTYRIMNAAYDTGTAAEHGNTPAPSGVQ